MQHTVADLENDVAGHLTGLDLTEVNNLFGAFQRSAVTLIAKAKPPETSNRQPIMLYDGVNDYSPSNLFFDETLIDIRPQGTDRQVEDDARKTYMERFDRVKNRVPYGYLVTFEYRNGSQIMRISQKKATARILIDSMSVTTGWTAAATASGLAQDSSFFYTQPASLRFNMAASVTPGTLTKTLTTALNLTAYAGVGVAFLALELPSSVPLASIKLRIGSSAANYYEVTATQGFLGAFYASEFQLVAFDLATATQTITPPVATAINYVQLIFTTNGTAMSNVRVGNLFISLPSPHLVLFHSAAVFLADEAGSLPSATISDVDDTILLNDGAYNIYQRECARTIAQQQGGEAGMGLVGALNAELDGMGGDDIGLYGAYRGSNPSQELRTVGNYYYDE